MNDIDRKFLVFMLRAIFNMIHTLACYAINDARTQQLMFDNVEVMLLAIDEWESPLDKSPES